MEVKFTSHDTSFRLADGQPNDGYLLADGLHLNQRGSNMLARNLGLASATTNVTTRKIVKSNLPQNKNIDVDGDTTHPFWQHARAKAARNAKRTDGGNTQNNGRERPTHTSRSQPQQRANAESCEYCAEPGHCTRDCGFRDFTTCRQCGQHGHNQKFCGRYRY